MMIQIFPIQAKPECALAIAVFAVVSTGAIPSGAQAAQVVVSTRQGSQTVINPRFATAEISSSSQFLTATASEYRGGVGVFASAASRVGTEGGDHIPQAAANAGFSDVFRASRADNVALLGNGVYALSVGFGVTGGVSTNQSPGGGGVPMSATANYNYSYKVGEFSNGGGVSEVNFEGSVTRTTTGLGAGGNFGEVLFVNLGDTYALSLLAGAFASGAAYGNQNQSAQGTADFGHTLRWLGVSRIQYQQDGQLFDAPEGYRLQLTSADGQFDYWNAAGANPFASAVPEPGSWAMMIVGFGAVGVTRRRTRTKAIASVIG